MKAVITMKGLLKFLFLITVLLFSVNISYAQPELPPRSVTIAATQAIDFGRFCVTGSGGTITLGWDGSRISTGGIALLSSPTAQPAIFEIKLCQGRNVTITYASTATLTGSNGGLLTLSISAPRKKELVAPVSQQTAIVTLLPPCVWEVPFTYPAQLFQEFIQVVSTLPLSSNSS